jgi:hypothetical protein
LERNQVLEKYLNIVAGDLFSTQELYYKNGD